jgi:hypothetical protein
LANKKGMVNQSGIWRIQKKSVHPSYIKSLSNGSIETGVIWKNQALGVRNEKRTQTTPPKLQK